MKIKPGNSGLIIALIILGSFAPSAFAVEGGLGRPISECKSRRLRTSAPRAGLRAGHGRNLL
jgi:hypothetical protein